MDYTRIVPITDLRRNFGEITAGLADVESLLLTKGGEPFAIMKATPNIKKKKLMMTFGGWKGTGLDDNAIWKKVFERKSRKEAIVLK